MERQKVISKSVKSIGHENGILEVEFANGGVYRYKDVSLETFQKLRISSSIGSSIHSDIIKKGYEYEKVS
jgi:hypothetical protein